MKRIFIALFIIVGFLYSFTENSETAKQWIRINQLGYTTASVKVAVWCTKESAKITTFELVDSASGKTVYKTSAGKNFGKYGPFTNTFRLNFSSYKKRGVYYLRAGNATSPSFKIGDDVYKGAADFCMQYMRQQRTGFNPYLKDSCHTHDGYTLYGPMPDSTRVDVVGGWHDASDYLQYSTTSANATYHLLAAYRDFPKVFSDEKQANGLDGKNGLADVLDEAKWGLDWLLKMHPDADVMFNQIADDRDHMGMRMPAQDTFYGRGFERPAYFINGEPQQRGKFLNNTKGTSSTAAKFASAFALGAQLFQNVDSSYSDKLSWKTLSALNFALKKPGVTQTASVMAPYIYEEDNWVDDMELAYAALHNLAGIDDPIIENGTTVSDIPGKEIIGEPNENKMLRAAFKYALQEPITPWLGADTARHYQWYPFINLGHYELAKQLHGKQKDTIVGFYKTGIDKVWKKAQKNAFYRGIPFIWCSNNLTTSFAIQCYWYKQLTNDKTFDELEQANFDWLFGCNPWGTSMVYGLPLWGDRPVDPHSAFTHIKNYPINGGLIDGPVYTSIYKSLIGITLKDADEYAEFQSDLAVYHDDYGDYSTNEPTMDGTASLIYLLAAKASPSPSKAGGLKTAPTNALKNQRNEKNQVQYSNGAIIRGRSSYSPPSGEKGAIAIVFTGDEFADGGNTILATLKKNNAQASFFFTGRFYRNPSFKKLITDIKKEGWYLGPHSDEHLLYCDWTNRDSLLVTRKQFKDDLGNNIDRITKFGVNKSAIRYFIPPYEWYNDSIAKWTNDMGIELVNFSPGTKSTADYTWPELKNYRSSDEIYQSIIEKEKTDKNGLNGFILLLHIGTDPRRTDKFYNKLDKLLQELKQKDYSFTSLDEILK